jgi:hypothetical protein
MSARLQFHSSLASLALVLVGSLTACNAPERNPAPRPGGSPELLNQIQPGDIVVAPVRNQTSSKNVPLDSLRSGLADAIVGRMYNPLDLAYVDTNWVEAGFQGSPAPDGLLVMAVTRWDASHLYSNGNVYMEAELQLFAGGNTRGQSLWSIQMKHTVNMNDNSETPPAPSPLLLVEASKKLAVHALHTLPMRDPIAAHARKP